MQTAMERQRPAPGFDAVASERMAPSSRSLCGLATNLTHTPSARLERPACSRRAADRTGFAIGWDYAAHGLRPPESAPDIIVQGHAAAAPRFPAPKDHDRFVRKWLLLRYNAWRRGRLVSEEVTPVYLRSIDVVRCPVTLERLTHATGTDSDWSVDRLNNDAGYAPGNLAVMSTRANRAKWTQGFAEVSARAALETASEGLSAAEWSRLASLMLGPCFAEDAERAPLHPLLALAPQTVRTASQQLQLALLAHRRGGLGCSLGKLKSLSAEIGAAQVFHRLVKRIRRQCERGEPVAVVFRDGQTFLLFTDWFGALQAHGVVVRAESFTVRTLERALRPCVYGGAWGLDTLGYAV